MKKISFAKDVLPHGIAVVIFLIVTIFFFNPAFFENKVLNQSDIVQWEGSSKSMRDYREQTGEEPLWSDTMFSGMPGYLVNVKWGNVVVGHFKNILGLNLPHPICNIFLAFLSYYIMLLAFGVRPYLAIGGAIAFGLSTYMIIGLSVGHSARIGAIAFMPLVMAGIHLAFTGRRVLSFGVTAAALALHFRENHLQMTYYLMLIVAAYGIVQLIIFVREKRLLEYVKSVGLLVAAVAIAVGTFLGPMWAVSEYTTYTRGESELEVPGISEKSTGLAKSFAFQYNYAILEPFTLLIPNFYGGSGQNLLVMDRENNVSKALAANGSEETFNQLAYFSGAYWGPDTTMPYYAGAIIVFFFAVGIAFAEKRFVWWLVPICLLAMMMSWGSNFQSFNYFIFDYLPGYNKFRSVTFTVVMIIFSMPLLGMLGVEKVFKEGMNKQSRKRLLIALASTGGLCLIFLLFAGILSFMREGRDEQLPPWFFNALADDRKSLLRSDAFRSLSFIIFAFGILYFELWKKITPLGFYALLIVMITLDLAIVNNRYFTKDNYKRKREAASFAATEADNEILKDKSYYRVYNIQGGDPRNAFVEARTSYFHHSVGGYHAVKLRRYQDLADSCLFPQTNAMIAGLQQGKTNFNAFGVINMLNVKYLIYGPERNNFIPNLSANGNAWFVERVIPVKSPTEELAKVCALDTRHEAVINDPGFNTAAIGYDSAATINLVEHNPKFLKYESQSNAAGLAVFSEIYYPKGWVAKIDEKDVPLLRVNYVLRAVTVPAGKHTITFSFEPAAYITGNSITTAFSWIVLLVLFGSIGWSLRQKGERTSQRYP
ncbi:MAG: YfhO family protein [Chryseolinea sp.]